MESRNFGLKRIFSLMSRKRGKIERWSMVESLFLSSQSFCFELIKGTLGNKPKVYGVTFRFIPKLPDDVRQGDLKTYWILVPNLLVRGLLENCIEQATKEKNLVNLKIFKFYFFLFY